MLMFFRPLLTKKLEFMKYLSEKINGCSKFNYSIIDSESRYVKKKKLFRLVFFVLINFLLALKSLRMVAIQCILRILLRFTVNIGEP